MEGIIKVVWHWDRKPDAKDKYILKCVNQIKATHRGLVGHDEPRVMNILLLMLTPCHNAVYMCLSSYIIMQFKDQFNENSDIIH